MQKRCQSKKKVLYTIFFNSEGPTIQVAIPKSRSITGHVYKNNVLKEVEKHNVRKRPKSEISNINIRILHENVPGHSR